jgi:hypothetical protein
VRRAADADEALAAPLSEARRLLAAADPGPPPIELRRPAALVGGALASTSGFT